MSAAGEARSALKWADGKVIKHEVDVQVCVEKEYCASRSGFALIKHQQVTLRAVCLCS